MYTRSLIGPVIAVVCKASHSFEEAKHHEAECANKRRRSPHRPIPERNVEMEDPSRKLRRMTLMGPDEAHQLDATDASACRNLEIFETSSAGPQGVTLRHVGLRCLHCSRNSSEGDMGTLTYPSSVASMGSSVRMMADRHLSSCPLAPGHVRDMARSAALKRQADYENLRRPSQEDERNFAILDEYCYQFCRNVGIVEKHPIGTGIIFGDENVRTPENVQQRATDGPLLANRQLLDQQVAYYPPARPPIIVPFANEAVAATPLVRRSKSGAPEHHPFFSEPESSGSYSTFRPQHPLSGHRGMYSGPSSVAGHDLRSPASHRHEHPDPGKQPSTTLGSSDAALGASTTSDASCCWCYSNPSVSGRISVFSLSLRCISWLSLLAGWKWGMDVQILRTLSTTIS